MNTNKLPIGTKTFTMNMGKAVAVEILSQNDTSAGWLGSEYRVRYTGTEKVCLDFGQNWWLKPGDEFGTRAVNIDTALDYKRRGY